MAYSITSWLYFSFARFISSVKHSFPVLSDPSLLCFPLEFAGYDFLFLRPFVLGFLVAVYLRVLSSEQQKSDLDETPKLT